MLRSTEYRAGLNGNVHRYAVHDTQGALEDLGVEYNGDGDWTLPEGASIEGIGGEDWTLTLADGTEYSVWAED